MNLIAYLSVYSQSLINLDLIGSRMIYSRSLEVLRELVLQFSSRVDRENSGDWNAHGSICIRILKKKRCSCLEVNR